MRKIRNIRKDDAVSPVIATILMVAITVVLAAVLYVMVMGMTHGPEQIQTPLGLNYQSKTSTAVNVMISSAPNGATTDGATISYTPTSSGIPTTATAVLYNAAGTVVANYGVSTAGAFNTTVTLTSGMTLVITPNGGVHSGDKITMSSSENTFGTSTVNVG